MTFTKKAATFLATIVLSTTTSTVIVTNAQAATFTKDEIQEVHQIQNQYKNLPKENFNADKGYLTFPTKFDMVDPLLNLKNKEKIIVRMSMNPEEIINRVEFGTSRLNERIKAINKLKEAGYKVGILIAPIILVDNWKDLYEELIKRLSEELSEEIKNEAVFELIFMTYSYVHKMINKEAFPNAINLFNPEIMTGRGRGKYMYKKETREKGEEFLRKTMKKYLPNVEILYIV